MVAALKIAKVILSLVALAVAGVGAAMTEGLFHVGPATVTLAMAVGGLLGYFGISPFALTAQISKGMAAGWFFLTALLGYHAAQVTALLNPHPHIWHAVGAVAIVLGVLSRGPLNPSPPSLPPPGPPAK